MPTFDYEMGKFHHRPGDFDAWDIDVWQVSLSPLKDKFISQVLTTSL